MRIATFITAAVMASVSAPPVLAQERAPDPVRIEEWSTERVAAMGEEIWRQDRASWVATDALLRHLAGAQPTGLRGWIVIKDGDGQRVRFLKMDGETLKPGWDIVVRNGRAGDVQTVTEGELTAAEQAQFRARTTAAENIGRLRCSAQLNAVVLNDPDSDGWLVWLLTATTEAGVIPMGGHYRFRISADGSTVIRRDMLSNSCLNMPRPQADGRGEPAGLMVSQIVSDGPVETHVFLSMQNRLPIYVMASRDQLFEVRGARIRKVEQ